MTTIVRQLERLYGRPQAPWDASILADFTKHEVQWYRALPADLRAIAEFIEDEASFPHPQVRSLFGVTDLIEWNSDDGSFGQLREVVADYRFDQVLMIGDDTYLDVAGQVAAPGSIVHAIGHELDDATVVAESLLALLTRAGVSSPAEATDPLVTPPTRSASAEDVQWTPTVAVTCDGAGVTVTVAVPITFTVARDATGFVATAPSKSASVAITLLPDLVDPGDELKMAALFQKGAKIDRDDRGGTVTASATTTRMLRAGGGFVRCYVKGGPADARAQVCDSLRIDVRA